MKKHTILTLTLLTLLSLAVTAGQSVEDSCIDFSTPYDQNFKWYNTNGSLPEYHGDHYLFSVGKTANAYQDAVSRKSIKVGSAFALSVRLEVSFNTRTPTDRDEFAVFVTDDTKVFTGDEFGFVLRQGSLVLNGYIQSPRTREYFKEFRLDRLEPGVSKTYVLKAVYSEVEGEGLVRFFVNDILVASHAYPIVSGKDFYLVLSMKKLSAPQHDTSENRVKIYSACIVNLQHQPTDIHKNTVTQQGTDVIVLLNTLMVILLAAMLAGLAFFYVKTSKKLGKPIMGCTPSLKEGITGFP